MSATFKVGEIAIMQNCLQLKNEGKECEIIGPLAFRHSAQEGWILAYRVESCNGISLSHPHQLRKKQPPNRLQSAHKAMLDCIRKAKQPAKVDA